jgi:hypothetical protein
LSGIFPARCFRRDYQKEVWRDLMGGLYGSGIVMMRVGLPGRRFALLNTLRSHTVHVACIHVAIRLESIEY